MQWTVARGKCRLLKKTTNFRSCCRIESIGLSQIIGTDATPIERQQRNTLRPFAIRYQVVRIGRVV